LWQIQHAARRYAAIVNENLTAAFAGASGGSNPKPGVRSLIEYSGSSGYQVEPDLPSSPFRAAPTPGPRLARAAGVLSLVQPVGGRRLI
jgi:hypothetical protein